MVSKTSDRITNETGVVPKTAPAEKALNFEFSALIHVRDRDRFDSLIAKGATPVKSSEFPRVKYSPSAGAIGAVRLPIAGYLRNHLVWHLAHKPEAREQKIWAISHDSGWQLLSMESKLVQGIFGRTWTKIQLWKIYRKLVLSGQDWSTADATSKEFVQAIAPVIEKACKEVLEEDRQRKESAQQKRIDRAEAAEVDGDRSPF